MLRNLSWPSSGCSLPSARITSMQNHSSQATSSAPPFSQRLITRGCRTSPVPLTGRTRLLGPCSDTPRYSGSAGHSPPGAERWARGEAQGVLRWRSRTGDELTLLPFLPRPTCCPHPGPAPAESACTRSPARGRSPAG